MSLVQISGNASGTGTLTIAAPNTNSNYTLTLPQNTATLGINGPAFSAYQSSAQTISGGVVTKITFTTEEFDTNSNYDTATSRFTPTVAGYYQISGSITVSVQATTAIAIIYKNGSQAKWGSYTGGASSSAIVSALIYLNGSTDYVELYGFLTVGQALVNNAVQTYFQGVLVRSA
jgi:hypothetical protein